MGRRTELLLTGVLATLAAVAVWDLSTWLFPYHSLNHDEGVYLQQAAMLLDGQLALYPPVDGVMRPWFFVADGGRLYPKYSPVAAAIFALGGLLGDYRLVLPATAGAIVALVSLVVRDVSDGPSGLLAAAIVLGSPLFLLEAAVFLPYAPTAMLNLAFAYAYLRADRTADRRWATAAGAAIGLAFFARPYTAVLFALPFVGHALWTIRADPDRALALQALTALTGATGVVVTLAYNRRMTGSALLFPYEAFAPRDGLGFGHREILGHGVEYTPGLALEANTRILAAFATDWVAGGLLVVGLAAVGLLIAAVRRSSRAAPLAGLLVTIPLGNVAFWGNLNILGELERPGDGLIGVLGPYYHFDLLLPVAAFAAVAVVSLVELARGELSARYGRPTGRAVVAAGLLLLVVTAGVGTHAALEDPIDRSREATETYERVYAPFADGPPSNAVVLLPTPYGDWLNHPFQPLRNDPGFDGPTVYAIDDRPFAVADAFPDRRLYRYGYRGTWAPFAGSPRAARLERVEVVGAPTVHLDATVGVPDGAVGVTARVATDDGSVYAVAPADGETLDLALRLTDGRVELGGDARTVGDAGLDLSGRDTVRLTVFVDHGAGDGVTYRFDLPVEAVDGHVRALTPRVEFCRAAQRCGGSATYLPESSPPGVSVETSLVAAEHNP